MELLGINLNQYHQKQWQRKTYTTLFTISLFTLISLGIATSLFYQTETIKYENSQYQEMIQKQENQIALTEQKISLFKQQTQGKISQSVIASKTISTISEFLENLPINGGLEFIQIASEKTLIIELNGKLKPADFEKLEQQLKTQQKQYRLLHLQSNEQQLLEIQLQIEWEN